MKRARVLRARFDAASRLTNLPRVVKRTGRDARVLELLVCPLTKTTLHYDRDAQELVSEQAGLAFPVRGGIPILLVEEARRL